MTFILSLNYCVSVCPICLYFYCISTYMVNKRHILLFLCTTVSARILALVLQLYVRNKLKLKLKCSAPNKRTEYCDGRECLSVCVCLSVRDHIFGPTLPIFANFSRMSPRAMARTSSGGVVIRYVLPVLWVTSRLLIIQGCSTSPPS